MEKKIADVLFRVVFVLMIAFSLVIALGLFGGCCWLLWNVAAALGLPKWIPFAVIFAAACVIELLRGADNAID